jgi:transcriptional regulator with XRE-family HTH domain
MAKNPENLQYMRASTPGQDSRPGGQKVAASDSLKLAELRESRKLTQQGMARHLAISQGRVSQIEHERDLHLSTLSSYVTALGGRLRIRAEFPDGSGFDLTETASALGETTQLKTRPEARD